MSAAARFARQSGPTMNAASIQALEETMNEFTTGVRVGDSVGGSESTRRRYAPRPVVGSEWATTVADASTQVLRSWLGDEERADRRPRVMRAS